MGEGRFEIVETLGVGGTATVYRARRGGRDVAVKRLHPFLARDPASVAALEDEADFGARVRHPNVVSVLELLPGGGGDEAPSLVMEWIDGVDLARVMRAANARRRQLPLDVIAAIACDALAGLHAAHESEIVHRDVSPENVLVGTDGVARVVDFGIASAARRRQVTSAGAVKGKLGYVAPERLEGRGDRRVDIFGIGVVLWEMLTGDPMRDVDGVAAIVAILCERAEPPSARCPDAACLDDVVMRAIERCPEDRFATADEMRRAIERVVTPASPQRVAAVLRALGDEDADDLARTGERPCSGAIEHDACQRDRHASTTASGR